MSKKAWFVFLFLIAVVGYLLAVNLVPDFGQWIHTSLSLPLSTALSNAAAGITTSPLWIETIAPNAWIISGITGIIGTALFMTWARKQILPWKKPAAIPTGTMSAPAQPVIINMPQNPTPTPLNPETKKEAAEATT